MKITREIDGRIYKFELTDEEIGEAYRLKNDKSLAEVIEDNLHAEADDYDKIEGFAVNDLIENQEFVKNIAARWMKNNDHGGDSFVNFVLALEFAMEQLKAKKKQETIPMTAPIPGEISLSRENLLEGISIPPSAKEDVEKYIPQVQKIIKSVSQPEIAPYVVFYGKADWGYFVQVYTKRVFPDTETSLNCEKKYGARSLAKIIAKALGLTVESDWTPSPLRDQGGPV